MFCSQCGSEGANNAKFCKSCGAAVNLESTVPPISASDGQTSNSTVMAARYADFWRRGAAAIVDWQIVGTAGAFVNRFLSTKSDDIQLFGSVAFMLFVAIRFAIWESRDSATIGKRLFHLSVLRSDQTKLSFLRALGRFFGRWLSAAVLGVGYLMQPFTAKKQALHDMMTDSVVVQNKNGREGLVITAWIFQILLLIFAIVVGTNFIGEEVRVGKRNVGANVTSKFAELASATPAQILPTGELAAMFNLMSNNTDLQRENKLREIKGQVVEWTLPVYEIRKEDGYYLVQTEGNEAVGAFVYIFARNEQDKVTMESLKTGSLISFRGVISDVTMRRLDIKPAILFQPGSAKQVAIQVLEVPKRDFQNEATQDLRFVNPTQVTLPAINFSAFQAKGSRGFASDGQIEQSFRHLMGDDFEELLDNLAWEEALLTDSSGKTVFGSGTALHSGGLIGGAYMIDQNGYLYAILMDKTTQPKFRIYGAAAYDRLPIKLREFISANRT